MAVQRRGDSGVVKIAAFPLVLGGLFNPAFSFSRVGLW